MVSLNWCKKQIHGVELIESKVHLSESYLEEAHDSFEAFLKNDGKWKIITGYYACYNALYSILMKCGIKSEIHDCSIKLMELFSFTEAEVEFMGSLKKKRIDVQYYLKKVELKEDFLIKKFIFKCEIILAELNDNKIREIREKLE